MSGKDVGARWLRAACLPAARLLHDGLHGRLHAAPGRAAGCAHLAALLALGQLLLHQRVCVVDARLAARQRHDAIGGAGCKVILLRNLWRDNKDRERLKGGTLRWPEGW